MENKPCKKKLISLCDEITNIVDKRNYPDVIGLDCQRTFDLVWNGI